MQGNRGVPELGEVEDKTVELRFEQGYGGRWRSGKPAAELWVREAGVAEIGQDGVTRVAAESGHGGGGRVVAERASKERDEGIGKRERERGGRKQEEIT
jgi:hypothetical protein